MQIPNLHRITLSTHFATVVFSASRYKLLSPPSHDYKYYASVMNYRSNLSYRRLSGKLITNCKVNLDDGYLALRLCHGIYCSPLDAGGRGFIHLAITFPEFCLCHLVFVVSIPLS